MNSMHSFQYLFPDAGVEKSSENDKTRSTHSNTSVTAGQQGNSDDVVCFSFHTVKHALACCDFSESVLIVPKASHCLHTKRNTTSSFLMSVHVNTSLLCSPMCRTYFST